MTCEHVCYSQIFLKVFWNFPTRLNFLRICSPSSSLVSAISLILKSGLIALKGQSNKIFNLRFFSSLEPVWATDQQVKIFSILVKNSPSYTNFKFENLTPQVMIPRRVSLPGVSYTGESIKNPPKHDSPRGMIPRRVTFFDTKVRISQRNLN